MSKQSTTKKEFEVSDELKTLAEGVAKSENLELHPAKV